MAQAREAQMVQLQEMINEHEYKGWDFAWKSDVTPWDAGSFQPALKEILDDGIVPSSLIPADGRALVPGCGRGYDAIYIAKALGLETLGTDISQTAVEAAEAYRASLKEDVDVRFEVSDFFSIDGIQFDLIYDYTFFVAISPSRRADWGRQMKKLVKPGGFLITLVFPIDGDSGTGPPFYVRAEHYEEVLGEGWTVVADRVPEISLESHKGRERMIVRRRL
ncbi:hypothetical protein GSI_10355 [Ganoderma sinense ZZ0214-1]|uniref:Methyltransferase domain-containing protein n=1 Tax=Ganoderma sinense ZZ0214-1 TaxID=1077348 RepID=A0A2G8S0C4_9APHY|nr:hypothetical protein GSI_10355 [Ganoderma sinense ZZ0214-1]